VKFEDGYFEDTSIAEHRVIFPNGKRLIALPANPDTARLLPGFAAGRIRAASGFECDLGGGDDASVARIQARVSSTLKG